MRVANPRPSENWQRRRNESVSEDSERRTPNSRSGRRCALGRQDVAPREASVSVTRGDGGRTGDKELVLELVFCEI